jgi:drug/metabolite transporter (DMT)-like permease
MRLVDSVLCVLCVVGVSAGQLLFRVAAIRLADDRLNLVQRAISLPMIAAIVLYGSMVLLWLFILGRVPLSIAFPFFGLCFFMVPLLAWHFLGDPLSWRTFVGAAAILGGIAIASR